MLGLKIDIDIAGEGGIEGITNVILKQVACDIEKKGSKAFGKLSKDIENRIREGYAKSSMYGVTKNKKGKDALYETARLMNSVTSDPLKSATSGSTVEFNMNIFLDSIKYDRKPGWQQRDTKYIGELHEKGGKYTLWRNFSEKELSKMVDDAIDEFISLF